MLLIYRISAHNEYEIGNWRAPRHRLSNQSYIQNYKRNFPVSEPGKVFPLTLIIHVII